MTERNKSDLAAALMRYGQGSSAALEHGAREVVDTTREIAHEVERYVPQWLFDVLINEAPGAYVRRSMQYGQQAADEYRSGDYGSAAASMGRALIEPAQELWWFVPGGGIVRRVAR